MKVTKEQVLRYLDGFQVELEMERIRLADEENENGHRILSQFVRGAQGSAYAELRRELDQTRDLVDHYGPEEVVRAMPDDEGDAADAG